MNIPDWMNKKISIILSDPKYPDNGSEYFHVYYSPEKDSYDICLDGSYTIGQLHELLAFLKENKEEILA